LNKEFLDNEPFSLTNIAHYVSVKSVLSSSSALLITCPEKNVSTAKFNNIKIRLSDHISFQEIELIGNSRF
jgi:hypothetical protein